MNLTQQEIDQKCEELWQKEVSLSNKNCPDCGAKVGENHLDNCDVPHCTKCGIQRLQCRHRTPIKWEGIWPGIKECYEQKLIWFDSGSKTWKFDLNTFYINNQK